MALGGESGRQKRSPLVESTAILAGSAAALRAAYAQLSQANTQRLSLVGAALIGPGDPAIDLPILSRATDWAGLDPAAGRMAETLVLAEAPASRAAARAVLERAAEARMNVMLVEKGGLRPMTIGDIVGRSLAAVDWDRIRGAIAGKRVLITGGGGSIGGELARRVASLAPARLTILDNSEFNLFAIQGELKEAVTALCDIRDAEAVTRWFTREQPDIVFHAAALKQVPLVEAHPSEGVRTNVGGCINAANAALAIGAQFVFVSTDKAVNPSGVMGASKRLGELYVQALDRESARRNGPRFVAVRLGNVLGSTGSVAPMFERQLAAGGPLTLTDPAVTRYFITIPQAADCLLQAAAAASISNTARGAAYVLDMGEPMAIIDLARKMIQLKGLKPGEDIDITCIGLRPGEKLHEELVASDEWREPNPAPNVMAAASPPRGLAELNEIIERLVALARAGADADVAAELHRAVAPTQVGEEIRAAG